ncbi:spermatogenesis-associated protein 22-like [Mya arenaria]|uniref:spermatogenesis-associated protein 22-like n=1 Tax=Mya arenaria TaxID=6604 RepID=UPI0022E81097|nr:spermatogenesis-associated protein 22-like [Mya arenaria]
MSMNNNYSRGTPAPIFNHRKRPRQAMISKSPTVVPGSSGSATAHPPGLMPVGGFGQQMSRGNAMSGRGAAHGNQIPAYQQTFGSFAQNVNGRNQPYPTGGSNSRRGGMPGPPRADPQPQTSQQRFTSGIDNDRNKAPQNNTQQNRISDSVQTYAANSQRNVNNYKSQARHFTQGSSVQHDEWDSSFEATLEHPKHIGPSKTEAKTATPSKSSDFERSTHFLTADVAGVRRWSKYKDNVQIVFEVFGFLDSAIARGKGNCREFLVRDEKKAALKCVFYEIDRQINKITRGQWIRLVGTFDIEGELFRTLSVRPRVEGEQRIAQMCAQKSTEVMASLTRNFREQ